MSIKSKDQAIPKWMVIDGQSVLLNTTATAKFFSVTERTLLDWAKRGAPKLDRGKWDIKALMEWRYGGCGSAESPEARKLKADAEYREAKAAQELMKLAVAEGKYIPSETVTEDLRRTFHVLKHSFLRMGHDIAIEVNSFDRDVALAVKKIVDNVVYEALTQLAETGEYIGKKVRR